VPATHAFDTVLTATGNNTGIVVPPEIIEALGAGKRPPVMVVINGYSFQTTVGVMSGRSMIPVSAAVRKESGLAAGDAIRVELAVAAKPRSVDVPADFAAAMAEAKGARAFFDGLSNSIQRYHIDLINGAKGQNTRVRRIEKAVALFLAGKPR